MYYFRLFSFGMFLISIGIWILLGLILLIIYFFHSLKKENRYIIVDNKGKKRHITKCELKSFVLIKNIFKYILYLMIISGVVFIILTLIEYYII